MLPFEASARESGMTLVEMMIATALAALVAMGGYEMLNRSQSYLAFKKIDQTANIESGDFINVLKKGWDFRIRTVPQPPGVPLHGYAALTPTDQPCSNNCPKLRLYIKRTLPTGPVTDVVTMRNICVRPAATPIVEAISLPVANTHLTQACNVCPKGQVPAIQITSNELNTAKVVLAAENRIFPANVAREVLYQGRMVLNSVIGMQACFTQNGANTPLSLDLRTMFVDQSSKKLQVTQKTQIFPFDNFANITLEQ